MRRAWLLALLVGGCSGGAEIAAARMTMQTGGGLMASDVGAVEILVLEGEGATCARVLTPLSPLDDPKLVVVAHALFANDGTTPHLSIPANKKLVFYAAAYRTASSRARIGRGCAEQTLAPGSSVGVTILISAEQQTN
jgi:hypothetical protein